MNSGSIECPPVETLERLAASRDDGDGELTSHIDGCPSCTATLEGIRSDNKLLSEFISANVDRLMPEQSHSIAGYEIQQQLESGGQGVVFKALHLATRREVALKMLLHGAFATPRQRRRFEREVEIVAGLRHPGIVTLYDSGRTSLGHHYLAMEFVDGVPLDQHMRSFEGDRIGEALRLFVAICDAVASAHQRGVIHRDLKPGNILVDQTGQPRVLDFGLARQTLDGLDQTRTVAGGFQGTLAYAAPEQLSASEDDVDVRSDIYALGAILYEMLTGQRPHHKTQSMADLVESIRTQSPPPPRSLNAAVDDELETIVLKAMAKEPARRYQSAGELHDDVQRYLRGEPIDAKRDSRLYLLRKAIARHKVATAAACLGIVLLTSFAIVMTLLYQRAAAAEHAAQLARDMEREQRVLAEQRERDLELVVGFQQAQLADVEPALMGLSLRDDLRTRLREGVIGRAGDPEQPAFDTDAFDSTLAEVNFTDAALRLLDEHIFTRTFAAIDEQFADQPLVKAQLLQSAANTMAQLGMLERAAEPQLLALDIRRAELGEDHPATMESAQATSALLRNRGRLDEAMMSQMDVLERRRTVLGESHPETLRSVYELGMLLFAMGRFAEAEAACRDSLAGLSEHLGPEHQDVLRIMNGLGALLENQGRHDEAEEYLLAVLEARRRIFGEDHLDTLRSYGTVADLRREQRRFAEAEEYALAQVAGLRELLGNQHPETLFAINNLAGLYFAQRRIDEAIELIRESVESHRLTLGPSHPQTLRTLSYMGALLRAEGRDVDAYPYYRDAVEGRRRALGSDHPDTLNAIHNLATLLHVLDRFEEAAALGGEAAEGLRALYGPDDWRTALALAHYGRALGALHRIEEAEAALREARAVAAAALGAEHPQVASMQSYLEEVLGSRIATGSREQQE